MGNIIIGIHGLDNKPKEATLAKGWKDAMLEGLEKNASIRVNDLDFVPVHWADVMYGAPDPKPDLYKPAKSGAIKRYRDCWLDVLRKGIGSTVGDFFDDMKEFFGMDKTADAVLKRKLPDLYNYYQDSKKRGELRKRFRDAILANRDKRIMVVGHSMGSIISYDVLRALGKEDPSLRIDHYVTIGSPLGIRHVNYHRAPLDQPLGQA